MDYLNSFPDNIPSFVFNDRASGILNWVKENRDTDPNAYELTNIFLFGAKCNDLKPEILEELWSIRSEDFERCNISKEHSIYKICEDAYTAAITGRPLVNDEHSHSALRKMAGIGLWLKQQQRDTGTVEYNNPTEFLTLLEDSKTLKALHPDLYERYQFDRNIDAIMRLQLENNLSPEVVSKLNEARSNLSDSQIEKSAPSDVKAEQEHDL